MNTSYRTVLFGAVVFICAAAPAVADSVPAVPKPATTTSAVWRSPSDSVPAVPKDSVPAVPKDSVPAVPKDIAGPSAQQSPFSWLAAGFGDFMRFFGIAF